MVKENEELCDLFLHAKPVQILLALRIKNESVYASTLAKITDCTYSHTVKILELFMKKGIVSFEKVGRIKYIKLTEKGSEYAKDFEKVMKKLK
ncbi:MAG: MarR family transcriptional regulator [DPANN group archaeon]|nr:MarR family transcriptional regulator [DPANN group archaeon]